MKKLDAASNQSGAFVHYMKAQKGKQLRARDADELAIDAPTLQVVIEEAKRAER